jgi:hypothetical protein
MRKLFSVALLAIALPVAFGQTSDLADSDRDGLSDSVENALLAQFAPQFLVSVRDCSLRPAEFVPLITKPTIQAENGAIYGQAFPRSGHAGQVELHFYHLWRTDCGEMGHGLDAEHVSALVSRNDDASWKALDWYAAAHEDTVCDGSQIARAATVEAEQHGPRVWISRGKHASFLSSELCNHGCGGDECRNLQPLATPAIINLGEPSAALNGATWVDDPHWPLAAKMRRTDFTDARLARLSQLPDTAIVWANPPKRGYKSTIRVAGSTADGIGAGARATGTALTATDVALDTADAKTSNALSGATNATGHGLGKTYRRVVKALHTSAKKVGSAMGGNSGREVAK